MLGSFALFCLAGCVGQGAFQKKVDEVSVLTGSLADIQRKNGELAHENEKLNAEVVQLKGKLDEVEGTKKKLENLLSKKTDGNVQRIAELVRERETLKEDISSMLRSREERVRDVSRSYEMMLETLKDEVASGRISVTELRGTVTITFADGALFEGSRKEILPAAYTMVKKLSGILRGMGGEREIRVEAPFRITGTRDGNEQCPYPWDAPADRAVTLARFLKQEGVRTDALSVAALGVFSRTGLEEFPSAKPDSGRMVITISPKE